MLRVASVEEIRIIEAAANATGLTYSRMMENAGHAVAHRVLEILAGKTEARVVVLVGPGNNGGDGLVAGRILAQESSMQVYFYLLGPRPDNDLNFKAICDAGLPFALADHDQNMSKLREKLAGADVVLDALFGIGARLPLGTVAVKILQVLKQILSAKTQFAGDYERVNITPPPQQLSRPLLWPYIVAVDCPSGLNCDTGNVDSNTLRADETITFIAAKPGQFEFPGASYTGQLSIATIGIPDELPELSSVKHAVADPASVAGLLPERFANANKGTFGKVMVVAGSSNYVGAAGLSAMAAYRSGSGLVTVGTTQSVITALSARFLEPTWLPLNDEQGSISVESLPPLRSGFNNYDAVLVGPGLGTNIATQEFLTELLSYRNELPPLVLDADALNMLSVIDDWWILLPPLTIITPHPGEMARLAKMTVGEVQNQRWHIAAAKAVEWQVILMLKGANTLVADPDGRVTVLPFATDALATAGTGDVLAGLIAGFLGQRMKPFNAAIVGGYVHGLAGMQATTNIGNTRSVIAGDVLEAVPQALTMLEKAKH